MEEITKSAIASLSRFFRRSFVSGLYLVFLVAGFFNGAEFNLKDLKEISFILPFVLIIGMIVSHLFYEALLPIHRILSIPKVLQGYREVAKEIKDSKSQDYEFLRSFRHEFLGSNAPESLKYELNKDMELRQFLTYLFSSSIGAIFFIIPLGLWLNEKKGIMFIELVIVLIALIYTTFGHKNRSYALGRSYGNAHKYMSKINKKIPNN